MFCPECGNDCGTAKFCPVCGAELAFTANMPVTDPTEPPIGKYEGIDGYVELSYCTMTFHKEIHTQITERTFFYEDIADVTFLPPAIDALGFLAVRESKDSLPLAQTEADAAGDETALLFEMPVNEQFCNIYSYLKQYVGTKKVVNKPNQRQNSATGICCPKCESTRCFMHEKHHYRPLMRGKSVIIALFMIGLYVYQKLCTKSEEYICLDCGHRWE